MIIEYWRTLTGSSPNYMLNTWEYDTETTIVTAETVNIGMFTVGQYMPPFGTVVSFECDGPDLIQYLSRGGPSGLDINTITNAAYCCTVEVADFVLVKTNNTSIDTPNGTVVITAPDLTISDYEASIDGGDNFITQTDGAFTFEDLPAGSYTIIIKTITGACQVTVGTTIVDNIVYPPPIIAEETLPAVYAPVFFPITIGFKLSNNEATVKEDGEGTYLEVDNQDGKDYLGSLPIIKIFDNEDYEGSYQITGVDDVDDPQKFYINATFTTEQNVLFVPFDRQVFFLYAEIGYNNFKKIADIAVYPDADTGEYLMRLEGFLQSVFEVNPPINNGEDMSLLRKYYVVPRDFDMEESSTILNAVYSAIPDLTNFLGDLIPLGPVPINFINEQTLKGYPVLFSYIDTTIGRIRNITSSDQTQVTQSGTEVIINALALNQYDVTWVNPDGAIADLQIDPALPDWITLETSPTDTVQLTIDTSVVTEGGDYDGSDYAEGDYLTGGPNVIVGCYEYEFSDGEELLFTLRICVFPIQSSNATCVTDPINLAWVNREGGWSSYVFEGRRTYGKDIDEVTTYKKGIELKRSSVSDVYDTVEVTLANKSIKDLQFISSLRQSIQAYLYSESTLQWSIPIVLDKQSFPVYTKPFKQIEVVDNFKFRYAEEIVIQKQ